MVQVNSTPLPAASGTGVDTGVTPGAQTGSRDVECHLSGRKGTKAGVGGGAVLRRYIWVTSTICLEPDSWRGAGLSPEPFPQAEWCWAAVGIHTSPQAEC